MKKGMVFLTIVFFAVTLAMPALGAEAQKPAATATQPDVYSITCPATVQVKDGGRIPIAPAGWQVGDRADPWESSYSLRTGNAAKISVGFLICYYDSGPFAVSIRQTPKPGYSCEVMPTQKGFVCKRTP